MPKADKTRLVLRSGESEPVTLEVSSFTSGGLTRIGLNVDNDFGVIAYYAGGTIFGAINLNPAPEAYCYSAMGNNVNNVLATYKWSTNYEFPCLGVLGNDCGELWIITREESGVSTERIRMGFFGSYEEFPELEFSITGFNDKVFAADIFNKNYVIPYLFEHYFPVQFDSDAIIKGDLYFVGAAGSLPIGSMYINNPAGVNVDISTAGQGVYVKILGWTTGPLHNTTVVSDALRVAKVGLYEVKWQVSADTGGINRCYEFALYLNGVLQPMGTVSQDFGPIPFKQSFSGFAILDVTDVTHDIDLRVQEPGVAPAADIDIYNAQIVITQVAGT